MTVIQFFSLIRRRLIVFIPVFAFFFLISEIALLLAPQVYEASTWLVVDSSRNRIGEDSGSTDRSRVEQFLKSQVAIIQSEEVIREAIRTYGSKNLFGGNKAAEDGNSAYLAALSGLSAAIEPNTVLIRITYRANQPQVAAAFANAVAASYLDRYLKIYSNPQAASFFAEQGQRYNQQTISASSQLQDFMVKNNVYAIEEQRKLLLERRDKATADFIATQGQLSRLGSELNSLKQQLASLRTTITLPVEIFGNTEYARNQKDNALSRDPPLLHVKLYQDAVQLLVKANSDLAGQQALAAHQEASLSELETQLRHLSQVQAEFSRLQQAVTDSETYVGLFFKKGAEAQADNAWRSNDRLSTIQVMQTATPPLRPSSPKAGLFLGFGLMLGLLVASGAALAVDRSEGLQSFIQDSFTMAGTAPASEQTSDVQVLRPATQLHPLRTAAGPPVDKAARVLTNLGR